MADGLVGAVVKGVVDGGAKAGGIIGSPFRAVKTVGNGIQGIAKNIYSFNKAKQRKSRFKKKV